jgi:hypothetical protein
MTSRLEIQRTPRALLHHRRLHHLTPRCPAAQRLYFRLRRNLALIIFTLALAVSGVFLSRVVAFNAVLAQARPQAPIAEPPTSRDVPVVSRTPSEKTMDELDRQLGKKLNICRGC